MFSTPILLLIFNRPDTTALVFDAIREQKPCVLFIAADGPRKDNPGDIHLCAEARAIIEKIDWECELKTLLNDNNLGCDKGPASGITWFFDHVDEGIILEDDCVPAASFFTYCENLLYRYRSCQEVMMICGASFQAKAMDTNSYYFSKYPHVWGWATWKRAWSKYNIKLDGETDKNRMEVVKKTFSNPRERQLWMSNFQMIINGLNTWDYQWMYWIWKNDGLCITPWENLVSNIGFGPNATHTKDNHSQQFKMKNHELLEIRYPHRIVQHKRADRYERYHILIEPFAKFYRARLRRLSAKLFKYFEISLDS